MNLFVVVYFEITMNDWRLLAVQHAHRLAHLVKDVEHLVGIESASGRQRETHTQMIDYWICRIRSYRHFNTH